jgi:hypothetical protein
MDPALTGSARLRDQPDHPSPPLMFGPLEGRLLQDDKPAVQHHQQSAHSHQQFPVSSVGQNMISMPFIKRHVRRRLANAKETCDKDLRKVMHSITTYVEDKLRESAIEFDLDDSPHLVEHYHRHSQFFQQDDGSDDGGDEADREYLGPQDPGQHSRHGAYHQNFFPSSQLSSRCLRNQFICQSLFLQAPIHFDGILLCRARRSSLQVPWENSALVVNPA